MQYRSQTDCDELLTAIDMVARLSVGALRRLTHEDRAYLEAWSRRGNALRVANLDQSCNSIESTRRENCLIYDMLS